ncbi:hypothetical protein [Streptomyces sp. NPDC048155]|uniref:hypothetical protein n=1 Tax=Streptomyces sp. NPDC048155 TaxID=3154818 RepID=UPI00340BA3C3
MFRVEAEAASVGALRGSPAGGEVGVAGVLDHEIYWTSASGSDTGSANTFQSYVFPVEIGWAHLFPANSVLFSGRAEKWVTLNISCWEEDHSNSGWYADLRRSMRDTSRYCMQKSEDLEDHSEESEEYAGGSALLSLVGLVAKLFAWLPDLFTNEDDLVCERIFGISRQGLLNLVARGRSAAAWSSWSFDGGIEGKHALWLRASKPPTSQGRDL